jgi:transposase InsO family protein
LEAWSDSHITFKNVCAKLIEEYERNKFIAESSRGKPKVHVVQQGKMSRKPFPKEASPVTAKGDVIVSDVWGQAQVMSHNKKRYLVTFTDMYSRYTVVRFVKRKSDIAKVCIEYIERFKPQFGIKPKVFRSDRETEYLYDTLQSYLRKEGIDTQCTVRYAPEQNGVAERKNRTLIEAARTMLISANLPPKFWEQAVETANYTFNRIIDRKKTTPYELLYHNKPPKTVYHEFGSKVFVKIPDEKRRKLDAKAEEMKYLGYDNNAKGFRCLTKQGRIIVSREVHFANACYDEDDEDEFQTSSQPKPKPTITPNIAIEEKNNSDNKENYDSAREENSEVEEEEQNSDEEDSGR